MMKALLASALLALPLGWSGRALAGDYLSQYEFTYDGNASLPYQRSGDPAQNFLADVNSGKLQLNGGDGDVIVLYNLLGPYSGIIVDAWRAFLAGTATSTQMRYLGIVNNRNELLHSWVNTAYASRQRGIDVTQYDPWHPPMHSTGAPLTNDTANFRTSIRTGPGTPPRLQFRTGMTR